MILVNELLKNINNDNNYLVMDLTDLINACKFNDEEELKKYEDSKFTIDGKVLSDEERVNYCISILDPSYDYENLEYEEIQVYKELKNNIDKSSDLDTKIINIIKIFSLTHRDLYLPYQAYKLIINKKY